jgi:hypothetical protein
MAGFFTSRFTPVECSMKAQAAIVTEESVVGMVTPDLVLIRKEQGNMFHTVLRARLSPDTDGTSIVVTTGADRIVMVFCYVFLAAFVLLDLLWIVAYSRILQSFQFSNDDKHNYLFILMPFVCTALGVGLFQLGRYASRDEGPFLTRLFVDATDAKSRGKAVKMAAAPPPKPKAAPKEAEDDGPSIDIA